MPSHSYDALVIGDGAVGSSIAVELLGRGLTVAQVTRSNRAGAASEAAGAMHGCFSEVTRISKASEHGRTKFATDLAAREAWGAWRELIGMDTPKTKPNSMGTHLILNAVGTEAVDGGNYNAIRETLSEHNEPHETVDAADIPWLQADNLSRPFHITYIPNESSVNAPNLLDALDATVERLGGEQYRQSAASLLVERQTVVGVKLSNDLEVHSKLVIIAAGARSLELLNDLPPEIVCRIPPLFSGYGVSMVATNTKSSQPSSVIRTPNRAFACGLHAIPREDGKVYIGGTNVIVPKPRSTPTIRDLEFLLNCAVFQLNRHLPEEGVAAVQTGNRPVPADGFPLIGPVSEIDGLYLATGTYRDGLHQSPVIASYIGDLCTMTDSSMAGLFEHFNPVRPPLQSLSREETVHLAVEELIASAYETHWQVRPEWPTLISESAETLYVNKANSLGEKFTPPPDVLAKADDSMLAELRRYFAAWEHRE